MWLLSTRNVVRATEKNKFLFKCPHVVSGYCTRLQVSGKHLALSLCKALFSQILYPQILAALTFLNFYLSPHLKETASSIWVSLPILGATAWKCSGQKVGPSLGSSCLFHFSQVSLFCVTPYPMSKTVFKIYFFQLLV